MGQPQNKGTASHERIDPSVTSRYAIGRRIGRGCYGIVFEGRPHDQGAGEPVVAIKKVLDAFKDGADAQRTYREVSYMLEFGGHSNVTKLVDVLCSDTDRHLFLVMEIMDSDLQKALRCQALKDIHKPLVVYQVLCALKYIHTARVMHRDVKPANILLSSACEVKLSDFGWARRSPCLNGPESCMTDYASSRWYRAPEILLQARCYTSAVDIWAIACICGEIHQSRPLLPGTSTINMIERIEDLLGKPIPSDIASIPAELIMWQYENVQDGPPRHPIETLFGSEKEELVDFLQLCLQFNPAKRMSAEEALRHPYLGDCQNPDNEPAFPKKLQLTIPDEIRYSSQEYRDQVYADYIGIPSARRNVRSRLRKYKKAAKKFRDPEDVV